MSLSYKIIGHLGKLLARNQAATKVEAREVRLHGPWGDGFHLRPAMPRRRPKHPAPH
jgi:hypothetical protein